MAPTSTQGLEHVRARAPHYDTSTDGHGHPEARPIWSSLPLAHAHAPEACLLCTGRTAARTRTRARSLPSLHRARFAAHAQEHALFLSSSALQHARRAFLVRDFCPFFGRPVFLFLLAACFFAKPARTHARTHGRPTTNDATCGPPAWRVADWKTTARGNTERALTAEALPPPCDPYRHALARRETVGSSMIEMKHNYDAILIFMMSYL